MSIVSIVKCEDYDERKLDMVISKVFDDLGGIEKFVKPGMKVAIKPNLVSAKNPEDGATTHPALVGAVARLLVKNGASVMLAESPGGLYTKLLLKRVYASCGMEKIAQKEGILLNYDISEVEVENPEGQLLKRVSIIKPLLDADLVINLPKLKTHGQMVYTGAVKNMFGAVPGELKAEYHFRMTNYTNFANALIDIFLAVKPQLSIMDAVVGMDGAGPTAGNPFKIGLVLGSENAFELDYAAIKIIGADPLKIPIIYQAVKRGLCPETESQISITGEKLKDIRVEGFDIPALQSMKSILFYENSIFNFFANKLKASPQLNKKVCTGCTNCIKVCPAKVIVLKNGKPEIDLRMCIRCFCCQELCPVKAISLKKPFVMRLMSKRRKFYRHKKDF